MIVMLMLPDEHNDEAVDNEIGLLADYIGERISDGATMSEFAAAAVSVLMAFAEDHGASEIIH